MLSLAEDSSAAQQGGGGLQVWHVEGDKHNKKDQQQQQWDGR
jgi:hypothetical protein